MTKLQKPSNARVIIKPFLVDGKSDVPEFEISLIKLMDTFYPDCGPPVVEISIVFTDRETGTRRNISIDKWGIGVYEMPE